MDYGSFGRRNLYYGRHNTSLEGGVCSLDNVYDTIKYEGALNGIHACRHVFLSRKMGGGGGGGIPAPSFVLPFKLHLMLLLARYRSCMSCAPNCVL